MLGMDQYEMIRTAEGGTSPNISHLPLSKGGIFTSLRSIYRRPPPKPPPKDPPPVWKPPPLV